MTWLIADIGGTHARFALYHNGAIQNPVIFKARDYPQLEHAVQAYLSSQKISVTKVVFAVAATILPHETIHFINHPAWDFDPKALQAKMGFEIFHMMNDFEAIAYGLYDLCADDLLTIVPKPTFANKPRLAIGAGTGLGVATSLVLNNKVTVLGGEGGYVTLPALTNEDLDIFSWLKNDLHIPHISAERLLSGDGLFNIYRALCARQKISPSLNTPENITKAAENGDILAVESFGFFCRYLGVIASNAALTTGAFGGVYLTGSILSSHHQFVMASAFAAYFKNKGRGTYYLEDIPVHLVITPYPAFVGIKRFIADQAA